MSLRMNPTPLGAIDYNSPGSSSSSIMTSDDVDAGLAHDEATLSDLQPAVSAAPEDDVAVVAEIRDEPQCEITVVEPDRPHNPAHVVQEPLEEEESSYVDLLFSNLHMHSLFLKLQQEQAPPPPPPDQLAAPIIPQPSAAATDVHLVAGARIQVAAGAGRVPWQRRIRNQVRRLGASRNEPANQASALRSGTRQIRRPRKLLDCVVPYFGPRKSH